MIKFCDKIKMITKFNLDELKVIKINKIWIIYSS